MKKLISFLVVFAIISSLSMVAFAADVNIDFDIPLTLEVKFTPSEVNPGDTVKADFYLYSTEDKDSNVVFDGGGDSTIEFAFDSTVLEKTGAKMGYGFSDSSISDNRCFIEAKNTYSVNAEAPLFTLEFTVKNGTEANEYSNLIKYNDVLFANGDGAETSEITKIVPNLTVKGSTPEKPATAEIDAATVTKGTTAVGNDGTEYTDVPTYIGKVAISNIGSKKVVLTPVATLNGVAHTLKSAPTITFDDNTALEEGKVEFKFALIGAPTSGVELTAKVDIVD